MRSSRLLAVPFLTAALAQPAYAQNALPDYCALFAGRGSNIEQQLTSDAEDLLGFGANANMATVNAVSAVFMNDFWTSIDAGIATSRPATVGDYMTLVQTGYLAALDKNTAFFEQHNAKAHVQLLRWDKQYDLTNDVVRAGLRDNADLQAMLAGGYPSPLEINVIVEATFPVPEGIMTVSSGNRVGASLGSNVSLTMDSPVDGLLGGPNAMVNLHGAGPQVLSFLCRPN